ncbi:MAG: response regulator transcription factor [Chloroflexi bacterium]|nr:response regulator transcription factor [Chloroflexota bacterium]
MSKIILRLTAQDAHFQQDNWTTVVHGGMLKSDPAALWVPVILFVIDGINYFTPTVRQHLATNQQPRNNQQKWPPLGVTLSNRDWHILTLLARSQGNQQIAFKLGLSHKTIRNRLIIIYKAIGVQSRTEAMGWAFQHGLSIDEP